MIEQSKQEIRKRFGKAIRDLRQIRAISQEELASVAGVHRTYIGMVERGEKNVTIVTLVRLANALEAKPSELVRSLGFGE